MIKNIYGNKMLIVVDHSKKTIYPVDLKTSSHREYDFYKSFVQWRYDIQARLYWRLIRQTLDRDDYFKDFKLADYKFIVVNNINNPLPLVWKFEYTQQQGPITLKNNVVLRDPEDIGKELYNYLQEKPLVPTGIKIKGVNSITEWLNKG